jgi:hypothetical protein
MRGTLTILPTLLARADEVIEGVASAGYQAERAGPPMRRLIVLALLGAALVFAAPVSSLSAEKLVGVLYRGGDYTKQPSQKRM